MADIKAGISSRKDISNPSHLEDVNGKITRPISGKTGAQAVHVDHDVHVVAVDKPVNGKQFVSISGNLDKAVISKLTALGGTMQNGKLMVPADKAAAAKQIVGAK